MRIALLVLSACEFAHGALGGADGVDAPPGPTADARVPPAGGRCGTPGALADDFADDVASPLWRVTNPGRVVERAETLAITPAPGSGWSGYTADPTVDLRDAAAEVEVLSSVTGAGAAAYFGAFGSGQWLGFTQRDGMLLGEIGAISATASYDPSAHRWWRISHAGTTVTLETSATGATWTALVAAPAPAWIDFATIELGADNPGDVSAPGTVTFSAHSTYVARAGWCPLASLSDGFNGDSTIGAMWARHGHTSTGCSEYETNGAARVDQNGIAACDAFYGSSTLYSLAGSEVIVRITAIGTFTTGWITYVGAWSPDNVDWVRLYFDQNEMCADGTGVTRTCVAYTSSQDLWRIRESGGTVYFEVQQSGAATWRAVHSAAASFDLSAVRPYFGTATDRAINQSINLSVDRFN